MSVDRHDHEHDHHDGHDRGGHDHDTGGIIGFVRSVFVPHSHDIADQFDSALTASDEGIRTLKISLIGLALTAAVQVAIVLVSHSVALLADTIHNFGDALTAIPLGIAFWLSKRPANRRYTYGYGRAEDLAGVFIVLTIAVSSLLAAYQAFRRLLHPQDVSHLWWVAAAGLVGFAGNELVAVYRIRTGRRIGSAALVADGLHARTDGLTSLAVVIGAAGVAAGWRLADPIVGLLITVAILGIVRNAARDILRRLMDSVDPALVDEIRAVLEATKGVIAVEQVRVRWIGHELHAEAALTADPSISLINGHHVAHDAEHELLHAVPRLSSALIHTSPAGQSTGHDGLAHDGSTHHRHGDS
jgi:cation diffusion facilitator family transporter